MAQEPEKGPDFESEFQRLGENLKQSFQAAWDSPTSQDLQDEIKSGFSLLGETVNEIINAFANSPSGQRLQEEVDDIGEKLQSGEVEAKIRKELLSILDMANAEMEKVRSKWVAKSQDDEEV